MKKTWIRLLAVLVMVPLALTACTGETDTTTTAAPAETTTKEAEETTAAEGEETTAEVEETTEGEEAPATLDKLSLGHLTFHTGPFGHVGDMFDASANFPLSIINEVGGPLGVPEVTIIHDDTGTLGEGTVARKLIENDNVDILLNVSHEYLSYRDWMLEYLAANNSPLMPSVHGGSIDPTVGGTVDEPIFRGAPMDPDQGVATALRAFDKGAKTVAVLAVETDGMQQQGEAAVESAKALGMEVVAEIDFQPEQSSYRSVISAAAAEEPDALLVFCAGEDGGTVVKNAAELGMSAIILGGTDWLFPEFPATATMDAIAQHQSVEAVGFTYAEGPAWDYYVEAWDASEWAEDFDKANSYTLQYYDLINVTMLAIEQAGNVEVDDWVTAMHDVSSEPGKKVYSYEEGIAAIRNGEEIDYDGVTGDFSYTETGVVGGLFGIYEWSSLEDMELVDTMAGEDIVELSGKITLSY